MSRTFRRKGYEATKGKQAGSKINGYYVQWQFNVDNEREHHYYTYRAMTAQEKNKEYVRIHRDNHANAFGPNKYYREASESLLKLHNKRELNNWLKNSEVEPMFMDQLPNHLRWDWY